MNFEFASPWLLILVLIIPLLAVRYFQNKKAILPATIQYTKTSLMHGLPTSWRIKLKPLGFVLRLIAITLAILALARPQFVQGRETITGEGVEIALALDISGSMTNWDWWSSHRRPLIKARSPSITICSLARWTRLNWQPISESRMGLLLDSASPTRPTCSLTAKQKAKSSSCSLME